MQPLRDEVGRVIPCVSGRQTMDRKNLAEIKARADEVKELLQYGPSIQDLLENDVPKLVAEVERLMWQIAQAGKCPHGEFYEDRSCVPCFGDGTEEWTKCGECDTHSWHRGGKCLRHDKSAPKPYELLKRQLEESRGKDRVLEQECAARVEAAEEQVKEIQASRELMRDALEYIKPRIGSMNLGESLAKIARALATAASGRATDKDPASDTAR